MDSRDIWVLIDDRAGNTAQSLGVAEALGEPFIEKPVVYSGAARLPNLVRGVSLLGCVPETRATLMRGGWPRLVVAAGRRLAPVARWVKHAAAKAGQSCALCQIMDPGWPGRGDFDLIVVPRHDRSGDAPNVLRVTGAPHRVTEARLSLSRVAWESRLSGIASPRIAVLVGGTTRKFPFTEARAAALGAAVAGLAAEIGGHILATTSRRTGAAAEAAFLAKLPPDAWVYRWGDSGENPYFGLLAWADVIVVTGDSMSMLSEACGTATPVLVDAPAGTTSAKHARLHAVLAASRRALPLTPHAAELALAVATMDRTPLNAADEVAAELRKRGLV